MDRPRVADASRRYVEKVFKPSYQWNPQRDSAKLLASLLLFDDPADLLYRIINPSDDGIKRLRAALSYDDSITAMSKFVIPLLKVLGSDLLSGGTCRAPLLELLEQIYRVPGLLCCLREAVASGQVADAAPVGWFLLTLATQLEEVRQSSEVRQLAGLLATQTGNAAKVATKLRVVLAGSDGTAAAGGSTARSAGGAGQQRHQRQPQGGMESLEDLLQGPGGRHDNDHVDYRSIKIVTTSEEALCKRQPYLPRALTDHNHHTAGTSASGPSAAVNGAAASHALLDREAALLDRQFRLLREDFVQPLRQALDALGFTGSVAADSTPAIATAAAGKKQQKQGVSASQANRNVFPVVAVVGAVQKPRGCVLVAVALPPSHKVSRLKNKKEREEYWSEYGKGTLPADALVCLTRRLAPGQPAQALLFGTIARRDPKEMAQQWPQIGVAFDRGQEGADRLLQQLGRSARLDEEGLVLVQVSTSFFSIRPVLSCLQDMAGVPLAEELAMGQRPEPLTYLPNDAVNQELSLLASNGLVLDPSQRDALHRCLTQRVALLQGPPGTGKTFVGALLCDALVRQSSETILVMCYTNHALDQFLEALLRKGITDIVRVGGRSKNQALAKYNLRELAGPNNPNRQRLSQAEWRRMRTIKDMGAELEEKVALLQDLLWATGAPGRRHVQDPKQHQQPQPQQQQSQQLGGKQQQQQQEEQQQLQLPLPLPLPQQQQQQQQPGDSSFRPADVTKPPPGHVVVDLWWELGQLLEDEYEEAWEQLEDGRADGRLWQAWLCGKSGPHYEDDLTDGDGEDGWHKGPGKKGGIGSVMSYGKAVSLLYGNISASSNAFGSNNDNVATADVDMSRLWQLPHKDRMALATRWLRELRKGWSEDLAAALTRSTELQAQLRALHDGSSRAVLAGARVIGCTTTGAAMYKELLRDAAVDPGVVLVEEAGELLEAHVLTGLSARTKHLIMIGDHKQLRPKVECWSLAVQSGMGFDLNVSLFERLVLAGFPHTTLAVQHRMHPDVSAMVRPTYPSLVDADSVRRHPRLRGIAEGRRVVFIDHRELEEGDQEKGWMAGAAHVSKVNLHEVRMVREIVRYLLRQGYRTDQLVVLTPYLGQLLELQREMSRDMQVLLDELDMRDLRAVVTAEALKDVKESSGPPPKKGGGGGSGGVRVATIDNYQGEEADVVVASLVRSNGGGSVGFLREPERINVLLSRARHGMLLIGNSQTLRTARSPEARVHWGRVLAALEEAGALMRGLPAQCEQHGTLAILDSPGAFAEHAPDGGCRRPCHEVLKCGHPCMLRCHPHDQRHERTVCGQEVLDYCSRGHIVKRMCSQDKRDVICATCTEVRRIEEEARREMARLEAEEDRKRRQAELDSARLQAKLDQLRKQQESLESERRARQEAVLLELEGQQLSKQVELQKKYGRVEMEEWEDEQRRLARLQLDAMEQDARAEAEMRQEKEQEESMRRRVEAAARQLREAQARSGADLQALRNGQRRLEAEAEERRGAAETRAVARMRQFRTMGSWKEAVAQAAKQGAAGVEELRRQVREAAGGSAQAAADTAETLDAVFSEAGIGARLVEYAAEQDGSQSSAASSKASGCSGPVQRGLSLIRDAKWLDAYKVLSTTANRSPEAPASQGSGSAAAAATGPASVAVGAALLSLCRTKLGLPASSAERASTGTGTKRPAKTGDGASRLLPPAERRHAVEHLAAAFAAAAAAAQQTGPTAMATLRQFSSRAAGGALAYLLHPDAPQLPLTLRDEALKVLQDSAAQLSGPVVPPVAAGSGRTQRRAEWDEAARRYPSLAKLLQLTGLAPVKRAMFELAAAVELDKERQRDLGSKQYNVRFYGNPGTGKTTVARMYAGLLKDLGILPGSEVVETSGSELLTGGVTKLKEQLGKLEKGGVLFLDEAYQLNPKTNPMGAQVLDYLLPEMENRRGKLVVVLAGYKKQMDDLMAHNEGLPSRFVQEFNFPDYDDDELFTIFRDLIAADKEPRFKVADERHLRIAARRLGRQRNSTGFGNARAVRNAYEQAQRRQSARVLAERREGGKPDPLLLVREDLLGPRDLDVSNCSALRELAAMRGLRAVKQQVGDLLNLIRTNAELEEQERPLKAVNLNRIFLGNPGTGKTTVAGLYGRILRDLGLLSKGDVEVRVPADFVGSVLGESEKKTEAILEATKGCVLVIDEAYGLHFDGGRDPYREAVVDTIVARVQGVPGDDRCVLLLGYEEQMEAMMRKANPGLARRFQMKEAWRFEDYGPEDLLAITREAAKRRGWILSEEALLAAVEALEQERRKPNFGNAGAVNNLLSSAALRMEARLRDLPAARRAAEVPQAEDFLMPREGGDAADIFGDLIGCKEVLAKLREWQATIRACQAMGRDPLQSFELNFRFVGAPGTGKTTVARRVGRLFQSLGLLAGSDMVSCSASDFVTGYVNQSSGKTRELFKKAVGGVLFIDEAYRLNPKIGGAFMQEVLDEIVQMLTEPAFMGKMVVILAGYDQQIEELMSFNPGLKSRFSQRLHFPNFTAEDAATLLRLQLRKEYGLELAAEAKAALLGLAQQLVAAPNWSNGRDVGTWAKRAFAAFSTRIFASSAPSPPQSSSESSDIVTLDDLKASLEPMLEDKEQKLLPGSGGLQQGGMATQQAEMPQAFASDMARSLAPPPPATTIATADPAVAPPASSDVVKVEQAATKSEDAAATRGSVGGGDFGGLSPEFLKAMQDALEILGHDLSSLDAVQQLAADPDLAAQLLSYLSVPGVTDVNVLREMVRQWQAMIAKRAEEERELARKRQRPVWRCAVCGRYGCPVAPYIERYEEVPI